MNAFKAVFKRELNSYFNTPVAYIFLVVFVFSAATVAIYKNSIFESSDANLLPFFENIPLLFIIFAPAIAMRMWAEERRSGTIELLFSLPITINQAVLAKFFASWVFFIIAIALTFPIPMAVINLGSPDIGPIITGYIGLILMAACTLSIGTFFSAMTKNQIISFILAVVVCAVIYGFGHPLALSVFKANNVPDGMISFFEAISFETHFQKMKMGVIQFRNIFYFVTVSIGFLYATNILLRMKKA